MSLGSINCLIFVFLFRFSQVFCNNYCAEGIYNDDKLRKFTRVDVGVCRSYRSMENSDRSYMEECNGDAVNTKRFNNLECEGDYDIVNRMESQIIDDSSSLRIKHEVACTDTTGNRKHNRLLYYDVADCDNPSIEDAHCVGTLVSTHKFCNVDVEESWKAKCQNNIYSVVFYDKPEVEYSNEDDYCKNTLRRTDDSISANFAQYGTVCVDRNSNIYQILFGENFQGADYIYMKLTCQDDETNTNRKNAVSDTDLANIEALLNAGAFLNLREHDGNLRKGGGRRIPDLNLDTSLNDNSGLKSRPRPIINDPSRTVDIQN